MISKRLPPQAFGSLLHVGWRYLAARGWQSFLMVLGIALGVAVVISIDLANASASRMSAIGVTASLSWSSRSPIKLSHRARLSSARYVCSM